MLIYEKDIKDISLEDLESMVNNEIYFENYFLEFKSEMKWERFKEKLLKTICGFANSDGGLFIYGIEEKNGLISKISGVSLHSNWDQDKLTIKDWIITNSEPIINSFEIKKIDLSDSKIIILIQVKKSSDFPHRVKIGQLNDFYIRRDGSTDRMEIELLRKSFELSNNLMKEVTQFKNQRISLIQKNESFCSVFNGITFIIHMIPFSAFINLNIKMKNLDSILENYGFFGNKVNFEGLINQESYNYTEFFRNGIIEKVYSFPNSNEIVPLHAFLSNSKQDINKFSSIYEDLNISSSYVIFFTLLNIKNCYVLTNCETVKNFANDEKRNVLVSKPVINSLWGEKEERNNEFNKVFTPFFNHFGLKINEHY